MSTLPIVVLSREERFKVTRRLLDILEHYIDEVVSSPEKIDKIVDRILRDNKVILLMLASTYEVLEAYRESPENFLATIVSSTEIIKEKLLKHGIDLGEALEMLIEHDMFKAKLMLEKPDKLVYIITVFVTEYLDDYLEYVRAYLASILLLYAMDKASDLDKLRKLAEQMKKHAEIIDTYTITFELMLEPEFDTSIHSSHRTIESLRKVLYSE